MTHVTDHPPADQLHAFAAGRLEAADFAHVESHVAACDECCRLLEATPPDSFLHRFKAAEQTPLTGAETAAAPAPDVPAALADNPRYRVLELLGRGGMGAVYKAEHRRMRRLVALKVIHPDLLREPAAVHRFHQEARAAARLAHPHIVTAYDADEAGDLHFLVMEYVAGRSLADVVADRGPLPVREACEYIRQAALGLHHAHERGMVHRDIKPHNLMLTTAGEIKILDFGLARFAGQPDDAAPRTSGDTAAPALTDAGTVMGTADYIAPEQIADARRADIRADIYSLGCTLYHLLAGRPPFPGGDRTEKFAHHANTPLPLPDEWSDDLKVILRTMTAKDPADRFETPAQVAAKLAPFTAAPRPNRTGLRRLLVAAGFALAAIFVAALVILNVRTDRGEITITTDDPTLELVAKKGGQIVWIRDPQSGTRWEVDTKNYHLRDLDNPDGLRIEIPQRGTLTLRSAGGGKVIVTAIPRATESPMPEPVTLPTAEELARRPNPADGRQHEDLSDAVRAYFGGGDAKNAPKELVAVLGDIRFRCPDYAGCPAYSPDGKLLIVPCDDRVFLFDAATGLIRRTLPVECHETNPYPSALITPDNRLLVATDGGKISVWDLQADKLARQIRTGEKDPDMWFGKLVLSPDGKLVAAAGGDTEQVRVWDVNTGRLRFYWDGRDVNEPRRAIEDVAFNADGSLLVVTDPFGRLHYWKVSPTEKFQELKAPEKLPAEGVQIIFSPDGKSLAVYDRSTVRVLDTGGKLLHTWDTSTCDLLAFSPDGRTLISVQYGARPEYIVRRLEIGSDKPPSEVPLTGIHQRRPWSLSPDGKTLAVVADEYDSVVRLIDTATGKSLIPDPGPMQNTFGLAFSPDGKMLATLERRRVCLWSVATGQILHTWAGEGQGAPTFSPDSRVLAVAVGDGIALRSTADGKHLRTFDGPTEHVLALAFSPDGKHIAGGGLGNEVWVWRTENGQNEQVFRQSEETSALTFSPDGRYLMTTTCQFNFLYRVWDLKSGKDILGGKVEASADALMFRPDGRTIFGLAWDGRSWLRDARSGKLVREFPLPDPKQEEQQDLGLALAPAADLAGIIHPTGALLLWRPGSDPLEKRFIRTFPAGRLAYSLAFSPEGRYVAVANPDGTVVLLRLAEPGRVPELR